MSLNFKCPRLSTLLLSAIFTIAVGWTEARAQTQQFRAAWADVFHVGMGSSNEVNAMVSTLVAGRYNAVIVQVVAYMDNNGANSHGAHWKSSILPWSPRVKSNFDPLEYLCQVAHANGIEVHAWLGGSGASMYRVSNVWPPAGNAVLSAHPEWFSVPRSNSEGGIVVGYLVNTTTYYSLDMGSPDAQEYLVSIIRELVTNYPIDGINWDDEIDGPVYNAGVAFPAHSTSVYTNSGLARFRRNTGYVGTPSATDPAYNDYRRRFKNELMARCQAEIQSIKTNPRQPLRHTTAALAYSPVPSSCDFTTSTPYLYYCDWAGMLQNGWVDAVVPQTYSRTTFNTWADRAAFCWQANRHIFPGIGAYLNSNSQILAMMDYAYNTNGLKGIATYSYAVANNSSPYTNDWWPYISTNLYTNVVSTPSMPWRNPATATEGIVWGRVRDAVSGQYVDDATVTVTGGPTVKTDGNGYYVATLVPATAVGTPHSTTASKAGMVPQTTNAIALAGDVVRYDFMLNVGLPAAPTGLVATAISASQINLSWADNSTNETAFVIARSTSSGGPYTDIAAVSADVTNYSNLGLASSTTYYYVVRATNNIGGSANSAQASATTLGTVISPTINTHPSSRTNLAGTVATFTVVASGSSLTYQWRKNGAALSDIGNISGATTPSLTLSNVSQPDAASYTVLVTNSGGSVTSAVATLTVLDPPAIIKQPLTQTIRAGSNATFTVNATGTAPLSYQWRLNGAIIPAATLSSYTRTNVQVADGGSYSVVVTNSVGVRTSANAVVTFTGLQPAITIQNIWNIAAGSRNYVTSGSTERGICINRQTGHVLIASRSASVPGGLGVYILDAATGSELGTLNVSAVNNSATFKLNKINVAEDGVIYGVNLTTASASSPLVIYRWASESDAAVPVYSGAPDGGITARWGDAVSIRGGGTNTQIIVAGSSSTNVIVFTTANGTNFSANVINTSTTNSAGSFSRGLYFGETNSFYVKNRASTSATNFIYNVAGNSAVAGVNISGLDSNMIAIAVATNYHVLCGVIDDNSNANSGHSLKVYDVYNPSSPLVVSNFNYPVISNGTNSPNSNFAGNVDTDGERIIGLDTQNGVVALRLIGTYVPPSITEHPQNQTVPMGQNATFTVSATGNVPLSYQWRFNGANIPDATQTSYTRTNAQLADAGSYSVLVTNLSGSVVSSNATLSVTAIFFGPTITTNPQSITITQGVNATFTVAANGNPAPTYQWRFNGSNIPGATNTFFTRTNAQASDAGSYSAVATNFVGGATSAVATLTVRVPPSITTQPQGKVIDAGSPVTFTVTASGEATLGYQWRKDGANIAGATTTAYPITNAQLVNAGVYSVLVTNPVGSILSSNARLTIVTMPINLYVVSVLPGGGIHGAGSGDTGTYQIEVATNIGTWQWLTNSENQSGTFQWFDLAPTSFQRYYRARLVP